jgi:hypothetical protein
MAHFTRNPKKKEIPPGKLLRQWSNTTNSALLDQVIATEALKRITERAEDAQENVDGSVEAAWNHLEALFLLCNGLSEEGHPAGSGADVVLVVAREDAEDQLIYGHRAVFAFSPTLSELMLEVLETMPTDGTFTTGTMLRVPLPHFDQPADIVFEAIRLLYSGKAFRRPPWSAENGRPSVPVERTEWKTRLDWEADGVPSSEVSLLGGGILPMLDKTSVDVGELEKTVGEAAAKVHVESLQKQAHDEQTKKDQWQGTTIGVPVLVKHLRVVQEDYTSIPSGANPFSAKEMLTPFEIVFKRTGLADELRAAKRTTGFFSRMARTLSRKQNTPSRAGKQVGLAERLVGTDCMLRSSDFDATTGVGWELPCHLFVLLAWSDVFKTLLLGSWDDSKVTMDASTNGRRILKISEEIVPSKQIMQVLCSSMYTQSLSICGGNVQLCVDCRGAAEYYQLGPIVRGFDQLLVSVLNVDTCLGILDWSATVDSAAWVNRMAKRYLRMNFVDVFENDERLADLSRKDLEDCISSDFLQAEEWMVFATLLRWSEIRVRSGLAQSLAEDIAGLVEHIRLPFIDPVQLENVFENLDTKLDRPNDVFPHFMWDEFHKFQSKQGRREEIKTISNPRFRLRFTNEIAQGVEARDRQARLEEAQRQRQRQLELEDIVRQRQLREDILRQRQLEREDILYMVCRMFHESNGRNNFEELSVDPKGSVPPEAVVVRMLRREQELRGAEDYQHCVGLAQQDSVEVNRQIQLQVVREAGLPDTAIEFIRAARSLYPNNSLMREIPNYVKFNRSQPGMLLPGMTAEDCEVYGLNGIPTTVLNFKKENRPLVLVAGSVT